MIENPLISVVVITYNSANTILETLESIKSQTYKNIELIISDDCSKDNTVAICKEWINTHRGRFVRTEIVTTEVNTGTSGNLNRAYAKTNSLWIKGIAGDDVLMNNCIETNVNYILTHTDTEILFSKVKFIGDENIINRNLKKFKYGAFNLSQKELLYLLLITNFIPAITLFIRKDVYEDLGKYDESIPLLEDWPFWIKAIKKFKKLSFCNEYTVYYRMSESSISLTSSPSPLFLKSVEIFYNGYLDKCQKETNVLLWLYFRNLQYRKNKPILFRFLLRIIANLNPIYLYIRYLFYKLEKNSALLYPQNIEIR